MAVQERAERTRANLIQAAAQVFDQVGYQRATLMTISEQARVTKGGLSFHFTTKAELARAVQTEGCAISAAVLDDLSDRPGPALDLVVDMTYAIAGLLQDDVVVRAGARISQEFETPEDPALHSHVYWLATLHGALARARRDGSLSLGTDVRSAAALVMSVTTGAEQLTRTPSPWAPGQRSDAPRESAQQWLARMWRVLRPALAAGAGGGTSRPSGGMGAPVALGVKMPAAARLTVPGQSSR